jgi:hypothetical protein
MCLSKILLDKECLGCGLTRATQHFIHFDFISASHFNKLVFVVVPIIVYFWIKEIIKVYKKIKIQSSK